MPKTSRFGNLVGDVLVFSGPSSPQGERLPRSDFFLLNLSFLYGLPNRPVFDTRVLISRQWPQSAPYLWLQTPRAPWRAKVEGPRLTIALPAPRHAPVRARGLPMRCCEHLRRRRTPSRFASGTVPRARARGFRRRRSVRPTPVRRAFCAPDRGSLDGRVDLGFSFGLGVPYHAPARGA